MPYSQRYIPGDRLVECDSCGFDYRFSEMKRGIMGSQKGLDICPVCFDYIHPNEDIPELTPKRPLRRVE